MGGCLRYAGLMSPSAQTSVRAPVESGAGGVEPIVGIDLGTTNSLIAVCGWSGGALSAVGPRCLAREDGGVMVPSVVRYDACGAVESVGAEAKARAAEFPRSTVFSVKRLMGRSLKDAAKDLPVLPFAVVEGPNATARVAVPVAAGGEKVISPQEVSAAILSELKRLGERALGVPVRRAVITVPAYFDDAQRQATRDAARLAGLEAVRIVAEPTAAALAYGLGLREAAVTGIGGGGGGKAGAATLRERLVVVYDLGGGTFDVSVLRITPNPDATDGGAGAGAGGERAGGLTVADFFQVLSTSGDTRLGGDDMDAAVVQWFLQETGGGGAAGLEPSALEPAMLARVRAAAEKVKIELSSADSAEMVVDGVAGVGVTRARLTRAKFEELIEPLVQRTLESCRRAMSDARRALDGVPIDSVILVGGATRVPLVRKRVGELFGLEPYTALDPDQVVALGAAVQASVLMSAGAGGGGGAGASGRGGAAPGLLIDVVPLSLGIETVGGAMAKLIMRNASVPARASEMFSTSVDNQTGIKINVLQGEREMAADCRLLGKFELKGIPAMPAGIPKLKVEFIVDASGVLSVRAVELRSGKALSAQVVPNHGLSRDEVERIERESVTHAREDMTRHRVVDLISHTAFDLGMIERQLSRHESALDAEYAAGLKTRIAALRSVIDRARADHRSVNPDEFQRAKEELDRASIRLHEVAITRSLQEEAGA